MGVPRLWGRPAPGVWVKGFARGSSWVSGSWGEEQGEHGVKEGVAPLADVVHGLKKADIERQEALGNAAMGTEPGAKEAPDAFDGVDVDLVHAVPISITGELSPPMIDRDVGVAPCGETGIDAVFIGVDTTSALDHLCDQGLDGALLDVVTQLKEDLAAPRDDAQDRRLVRGRRAASPPAFQPSSPSGAPLFWTSLGCPLCPATR